MDSRKAFLFAAAAVLITSFGCFQDVAAGEPPLYAPSLDGKGTHTVDPSMFARQHEDLVLDAQALREQAVQGQSLGFHLFGKDYAFVLAPVKDMTATATIKTVDVDGNQATLPVNVILFRGVGAEGATATLSPARRMGDGRNPGRLGNPLPGTQDEDGPRRRGPDRGVPAQ